MKENNMEKYLYEDVKKISKEKGLYLISEKYNNEEDFLEYKDKNGYKYRYRFCDIKIKTTSKLNTWSTNNPYSTYNKMIFMKDNVKSDTVLLDNSEIIPAKEYHKFICGRCNKKFEQIWYSFINSPYHVCPDCICQLKRSKKKSYEYIIEEIKEYGLIPLFKEYTGTNQRLLVKDKDEYKFYININKLRKNETGKKFHKSNDYTIDNIKRYCFLHGIKTELLSDVFENGENKMLWRCECGELFYLSWEKFKEGKTRCNRCTKSQSNYEIKIENYLRKLKIPYKKQYRIPQCANKSSLPFDFYLTDKNIFIEVDGIGHYKPVRFNGISKERAQECFELTKYRDNIKNNFCKENNLKLIRISYIDIDNCKYENILKSIL